MRGREIQDLETCAKLTDVASIQSISVCVYFSGYIVDLLRETASPLLQYWPRVSIVCIFSHADHSDYLALEHCCHGMPGCYSTPLRPSCLSHLPMDSMGLLGF